MAAAITRPPPWAGPPDQDPFWNASFGAYRTVEEVASAEEALGFLRAAHARLRLVAPDDQRQTEDGGDAG